MEIGKTYVNSFNVNTTFVPEFKLSNGAYAGICSDEYNHKYSLFVFVSDHSPKWTLKKTKTKYYHCIYVREDCLYGLWTSGVYTDRKSMRATFAHRKIIQEFETEIEDNG